MDERNPLPPVLRDWLLVSKFGWTKQQIEEQPAVWLDWILAIEHEHEMVKNKATERGNDVR